MPTLFELILIAIVGFWTMAYFMTAVIIRCVSWLVGLLRMDKNKVRQTIETPWSEARKMYMKNLEDEFKNLKRVDKAL